MARSVETGNATNIQSLVEQQSLQKGQELFALGQQLNAHNVAPDMVEGVPAVRFSYGDVSLLVRSDGAAYFVNGEGGPETYFGLPPDGIALNILDDVINRHS